MTIIVFQLTRSLFSSLEPGYVWNSIELVIAVCYLAFWTYEIPLNLWFLCLYHFLFCYWHEKRKAEKWLQCAILHFFYFSCLFTLLSVSCFIRYDDHLLSVIVSGDRWSKNYKIFSAEMNQLSNAFTKHSTWKWVHHINSFYEIHCLILLLLIFTSCLVA